MTADESSMTARTDAVEHPDYSFRPELFKSADPYALAVGNLRIFLDRFAAAVPDDITSSRLAYDLDNWARHLAQKAVPERDQVYGRRMELPGRGQTTSPMFQFRDASATRVTGTVTFGRYFLGNGGAVHGGAIPLLFDEVFGRLVNSQRRPSRTAYLNTDYRAIALIGAELEVDAWLESVDGRKRIVCGTLHDGIILCAEARALFVELRPDQA